MAVYGHQPAAVALTEHEQAAPWYLLASPDHFQLPGRLILQVREQGHRAGTGNHLPLRGRERAKVPLHSNHADAELVGERRERGWHDRINQPDVVMVRRSGRETRIPVDRHRLECESGEGVSEQAGVDSCGHDPFRRQASELGHQPFIEPLADQENGTSDTACRQGGYGPRIGGEGQTYVVSTGEGGLGDLESGQNGIGLGGAEALRDARRAVPVLGSCRG